MVRGIPSGSHVGHRDTRGLLRGVGAASDAGLGVYFGLGCGYQRTAQDDAHTCEFLCKKHPLPMALRPLLALGWVAWWWLGLFLCHSLLVAHRGGSATVTAPITFPGGILGFWAGSGIPEIPL